MFAAYAVLCESFQRSSASGDDGGFSMLSFVNGRLLCSLFLTWLIGLTNVDAQKRQALPDRKPLAFDLPIKAETSKAKASVEDWPTEIWQQHVTQSLTELLATSGDPPPWVSGAIQFEDLRTLLEKTHQLGSVSVYRPKPRTKRPRYHGHQLLAQQLTHLKSPFVNQTPKIHVKVIEIDV